MRLLLDTHIFIWALDDDPKLSDAAWSTIEAAEAIDISSSSICETTIKYQLGKLHIEPDKLAGAVAPSGFLELPINHRHVVAVRHLPALHRDPFDRLLIAQAMSEPLHLLTADGILQQYSELVHLV